MELFTAPPKIPAEEKQHAKKRLPANTRIVGPGELVEEVAAFMGGHGTYTQEGRLYAQVAGHVVHVGKLCTVQPLRTRYVPESGHIVVGRICEMRGKAWKLDINSRQQAVLQLSALHLPDIQRRKTETDEAEMRRYLAEGDVVAVEVADCRTDRIQLQTRNTNKTGKLKNGTLVAVPASLIVRGPSQVVQLRAGIDMVLGMNGYIWIRKHESDGAADIDRRFGDASGDELSSLDRLAIARACNVIGALARHGVPISEAAVNFGIEAALQLNVVDLLQRGPSRQLADTVRHSIVEANLAPVPTMFG